LKIRQVILQTKIPKLNYYSI